MVWIYIDKNHPINRNQQEERDALERSLYLVLRANLAGTDETVKFRLYDHTINTMK